MSHAVISTLKTLRSVFGPVGAAVGSAIGAGATISEAFVGRVSMSKFQAVPTSVIGTIDNFKAAYKNEPFEKNIVGTRYPVQLRK